MLEKTPTYLCYYYFIFTLTYLVLNILTTCMTWLSYMYAFITCSWDGKK